MKLWILAQFEVVEENGESVRKPKLAVQARYSLCDLGDKALCRVSIMPEQLETLQSDTNIKILTDREALQLIKSINPNAELEDVDIADVELERLARQEGFDSHEIKKDVIIPTRGRRVLQCQEAHLLRVIAKKKNVDISDIEEDIEVGKKHAYNRALARIRGSAGLRSIMKERIQKS